MWLPQTWVKYKDFPVKRWREMFCDVGQQLLEYDDPAAAAAAAGDSKVGARVCVLRCEADAVVCLGS